MNEKGEGCRWLVKKTKNHLGGSGLQGEEASRGVGLLTRYPPWGGAYESKESGETQAGHPPLLVEYEGNRNSLRERGKTPSRVIRSSGRWAIQR